MYKEKFLNIPIYDRKLLIIFTNDEKKLAKRLNFKSEEEIASMLGCVYKLALPTPLSKEFLLKTIVLHLNFERHMIDFVDEGTIAHEAVHVALAVFEAISTDMDSSSEEPYAYLVGWIVNEVYKFMKESKVNFQKKV